MLPIIKNVIRPVIVGMGKTLVPKLGPKTELTSGLLTSCTAFIFKVRDKSNKVVGVGMTHRGYETSEVYLKEFYNSFRPYGGLKNIKIEPVIIQTATDTSISPSMKAVGADIIKGHHNCTYDALLKDLGKVIPDLKKTPKEQAPMKSIITTESYIKIDPSGSIDIERNIYQKVFGTKI